MYCYSYSENMHIIYVYKLSKTIEIMSNFFKSQLEEALIKLSVTILTLITNISKVKTYN